MILPSIDLPIVQNSLVTHQDVEYAMLHSPKENRLIILAPNHSSVLDAFSGEISELKDRVLLSCPMNAKNAAALRDQLPWLNPVRLGLNSSLGMGDRLGIATPGHVRAVNEANRKVSPIFAQQSIREMTRTGRSPQQVMDDATWGVFEGGWQGGIGADADHLKTPDDIDACLEAGCSFFTFDPGEHVDNQSQHYHLNDLYEVTGRLPEHIQVKCTDLLGKTFDIEGIRVVMDELSLLRAIAKYGKAIVHLVKMHQHLKVAAGDHFFEVEISMDETELPTSAAEHVYLASELHRLGVNWVSFAPRYVGRFEKGVDYIGDIQTLEADFTLHAAIARQFGPYKLSLHSGSDKFSVYPMFIEKTNGLAHIKTAGTSYLEALRTIAALDIALFKEIYSFALDRFETDKHSYLLSAQIENAPRPEEVNDWPGLLDQFDAREILHVTYGSVLTEKVDQDHWRFHDRLMNLLRLHRDLYFDNICVHFQKHLTPFTPKS